MHYGHDANWHALIWAAASFLTLIALVTVLFLYLVRRGRRGDPDPN
jgi:hypothetical protein